MIEALIDGQIGRITLNRPETHNALEQSAMRDLTGVLFDWANTDMRAVILTGTGRSFCSGASLGDVAGEDWGDNPLTALCDALEAFPAPTICALNGGVYGGGVELAMACDFRVGVTGMKMFVPPAKLGIHYDPAGIGRVQQRLGAQMARRVFLLAEKFEDQALLDCGFLDYLLEPGALGAKAEALANTVASLAPMAVQGMKRTILEISRGTLDADAAAARIASCFASDDHREGLAAMQEKRPPKFTGR